MPFRPIPSCPALAEAARRAWSRLPRRDRIAATAGAATASLLLAAMAVTCQASVQRGEQFRAEQRESARQAASVAIRTAAASAVGMAAW